ncbi:MAG: hypothetical protein V4714_19920 [Bacteroidota bacterium]
MKYVLTLLLFVVCFGCKPEAIDKANPTVLLREISVNGKTDQIFEYDGVVLTKEKSFGVCDKNPTDEVAYLYQNDKLSQLSTITRALYSNSAAQCDPATGLHLDETYEYDNQNRIIKVTRITSYTEYYYNANGKVEKQILYGGSSPAVSTFTYDSKGNLIQTTDPSGNTTQYQYDDKINPFYVINQRPGWISAFNISPNNVIQATGSDNFTRKFEYNAEGLPSQLLDSNGLTYTYHYN